MEIVDTQIHEPHPLTPWHDGDEEQHRERNVELALTAMDALGVDAAVLHASEDFANTAYRLYPDKFRGMVDGGLEAQNASDADRADEVVKEFSENPAVLGFRIIPCFPPDGPNVQALQDGKYEPWFVAAEKYGLPIVVFLLGNLPLGAKIAKEHPNMTLVVDQVGMAPVPTVPITPERLDKVPELLELANYPNVAVKFVGFTGLSYEEYPFRDLWETFDQILDAFSPERLMWGADHTRLMGFSRSHPLWKTYADDLNFIKFNEKLSDSDKELMLGKAVRKIYNWPKD